MRTGKALFLAVAIAVGGIGAVSISAALAQSAPSSPVVVINLAKVRADAPAWTDMNTKLKTLVDQKSNEFRTQNQSAAQLVENEGRALQPLLQGKTQAQIMADAALKTRLENQVRRERELQQKQQLFQYSVQATSERADAQLLELLDPIIGQIMTQRGAVVVLDRSQIAKANASVEITQEATTRFSAANPRAPQPTWVPVTIAPAEGAGAAPATLPKAAPKK
jgi:Skp family chaperone for outer membrane proteins